MIRYLKGFGRGLLDFAGAISAIGVVIGLMWFFGSPVTRDYVYTTFAQSPAFLDVRADVDGIVADRKELSKKREKQFETVTKQLNDLALKVEGTNQRILTQIEGLTALVSRLNTQLDSLNGRLRLRLGSGATKYQDRITADEAPQ